MSTKDEVRRIRQETAELLASHRRERAEARRMAAEKARWDRERRVNHERVRQAIARRDAADRQAFLDQVRAEVRAVCATAPAVPPPPTLVVAAADLPTRPTIIDQRVHRSVSGELPTVDDLTRIEGIDASIQRRLYVAGIFSFHQLATTPPHILHHVAGDQQPIAAWQARAIELHAGLAG